MPRSRGGGATREESGPVGRSRMCTMHRMRWILAALAVGAVVATSGALAGLQLTKPGVVRITNRELTRKYVDLGDPGRSAGDLLVATHLVYNTRITERALGHEEMLCTSLGRGGVLGGGARSCQIYVYLPEGRLLASGNVHNLLFFTIPVIGGTGIYDNIRGALTVTFLGGQPARQLLLFRLTV